MELGQQIVRSGEQFNGQTLETFRDETINDAGQVAFGVQYVGSTNTFASDAILLFSGGSTTSVVKKGDAATDGNGQVEFLSRPHLNHSGQVAYFAQLTGTTGGDSDDEAIIRSIQWRAHPRSFEPDHKVQETSERFLNCSCLR